MISLVFSIISVLSYSTCPYIPWEWMILPGEQPVSTVCYIEYIYWVFVWIFSTILSIIGVLSYFACPYTHWKQMILLTYKYHGILVYIFYDCMNDINSIVKCKCDMLIDKSLYTMKSERSCPFSNFWTTVYYIWCINCVFAWMITPSCQS